MNAHIHRGFSFSFYLVCDPNPWMVLPTFRVGYPYLNSIILGAPWQIRQQYLSSMIPTQTVQNEHK